MARGLGLPYHGLGGYLGAAAVVSSTYRDIVPPEAALAFAVALPLVLALARADLSRAAFAGPCVTIAGALVPATLLGFFVRIRLLEEERGLRGDLVLLLLSATWASDAGAYYVGRALGRHRMAPRVSPKKTWEGAMGGALGAAAGAFVYRAFLWGGASGLRARDALAIAAVVSVLGPAGDLAESVLKRSAGVKDSGKIVPGHGGMLDRVDSMLFTAPVLYYYYGLVLP